MDPAAIATDRSWKSEWTAYMNDAYS